jgi:hypothetical protein
MANGIFGTLVARAVGATEAAALGRDRAKGIGAVRCSPRSVAFRALALA